MLLAGSTRKEEEEEEEKKANFITTLKKLVKLVCLSCVYVFLKYLGLL